MPTVILTNPVQPPAIGAGSQPSAPITPHVQMPFAFNASGRPTYCDQDSLEDVESCVLNLLSCPQGSNPYDATFGRPDYRGDPEPLQMSAVTAVVTQYEPRVNELGAEESIDLINRASQIVVSGDA